MARDGERGRGDWKARSGSQNSGPYAEASGDTGPVDIAAVRRDDALIDAIAGDGPVQTGSTEEYQLAAVLANWRAEIMAEPLPAGPDLDAIVAAVNQEIGARQARIGAQSRGRLRLLRPIAGAAAALALVIGGLTAFSYNANPGDPLWKVKEVVFSEQAQSTIVQNASSDLQQAQQLVQAGKPEQAQALMERAASNATQVNDSGKKDDLLNKWQQVLSQIQTVAPSVAQQLATIVPTTTPPVTTGPPVTTTLVVPTTAPNPGGEITPPSTSINPMTVPSPETNPSQGGGNPSLPSTPPVNTLPAQPSSEPSEPATQPSAGVPTTVPVQPSAGAPGTISNPGPNPGGHEPGSNPGGHEPGSQPPVEKPPIAAPPVVPTTIPVVPLPVPGGIR
ncbi:anti-sigma-D factor RsdA [Nocardia sp. NPDC088792]|uniref:anti-sigma-D factor RsdA n=1 Tax=Nocardia sp. NPDC088792 TaxID=3364332 RepID=UPI00381B6C68